MGSQRVRHDWANFTSLHSLWIRNFTRAWRSRETMLAKLQSLFVCFSGKWAFISHIGTQTKTKQSIQCLKTSMSTEEKSSEMLRIMFVISLVYYFLLATHQIRRWRRAEHVTPKWIPLGCWLFWIKVTKETVGTRKMFWTSFVPPKAGNISPPCGTSLVVQRLRLHAGGPGLMPGQGLPGDTSGKEPTCQCRRH